MKTWKPVIFLALFSFQAAHAQEQLAIRLNEQGILKVLKMAVQYNTSSKESRTVVIPKNIYKFTIPKSQLLSNPVVPVLNEISDINMNQNLDFYFNTSDIKVTGEVDSKSIKTAISNSGPNGFDLKLSLNLPKVVINGASMSLCEDKQKGTKNCGKGLKTTLSQLRIATTSRPVILSIMLRLRTDGKVARVSVRSVESNLEGKSAPGLDINFSSIEVPKISIVIDGQESELDTSKLKEEILKRKSYLAKQLMGFAGEFIASDLAEMINIYLVNKTIATSYEVYRKEKPVTFNEFIEVPSYRAEVDNTYVRPPVYISSYQSGTDPMTSMMGQISDLIRNAQVDISLKRIATPGNKDVELAGVLGFVLNNKRINVKNTIGNSTRTLPKLDLSAHRNNDINLAISEPLINGALDLATTTGLFQEVFDKISSVPGFSVKTLKMHFSGNNAIVAVVNAQVDLKKLSAKGSVKSWFKNKIAAWLERNNNNAVIYFPIEVSVIPVIKQTSAGAGLQLKVLSPFNGNSLLNRFKYPSNVPNMTETVKDGVMEELKASLLSYVNKAYDIDLSKFLNQSGVVFKPKGISINQGAYLLLNLDVTDIKFNSLNPNKR